MKVGDRLSKALIAPPKKNQFVLFLLFIYLLIGNLKKMAVFGVCPLSHCTNLGTQRDSERYDCI